MRTFLIPLLLLSGLSLGSSLQAADEPLLVASYDVAREVYKDLTAAFIAKDPGDIQLSHGGSSKQARAVIDGLPADLVSMNQSLDIDQIAKAKLLPADWSTKQAYGSAPSWSEIQFVVRAGNPKGIKDWGDLLKDDIAVVIPNPKTSGNGRYSYLAAWAWALHQPGGTPETAKAFVKKLFTHVPVLDAGGRGATTTFAQRGIGDVLLTFENEIWLVRKEFAADAPTVVVPSLTIRADNPVAVVTKVAAHKGTTRRAEAFLAFHFTPEAQELFAKHGIRPADEKILAAHQADFPTVPYVTVDQDFGGWAKAQAEHFADGGIYDQITRK